MKKIIVSLFSLFILTYNSYSQLDDILKKIPGAGDLFEEAVTTSIKDAYPNALWLGELDKQLNLDTGTPFSTNLSPGYYKFRFNTFCLHAGTYAPTEGAGYLVAPLKGAKAKLIKDILTRYSEHPEIDQKDVQILLWGVEAGQKFSNYPHDFQLRVMPLLKPEEIAAMEVDVKQIAYDLLPQDVKNVLDLYSNLRGKISDASSTYEDIEKIAVKTGIAPIGKGSKNIIAGTWTSIGEGVYMRCFPEGFSKSNVEIYIPSEVNIQRDNNGNITSLDDGSYKIQLTYESGASKFKTAVVKNISTNEVVTLENNTTDDASVKKDADDFISLVKKSFGKKKSGGLTTESLKSLAQLKSIERNLNVLIDKNGWTASGYTLSVNALNGFISEIESGNKKGGGKSHKTGLSNVNGLVFAPANTSDQRLGNGGPEPGPPNPNPNPNPKKPDKNCNVTVSMAQVNDFELPEPDHVYTATVNIYIDGTDDDCNAEEIRFELFDVSKERGRCMNDMEQYDDVDEDLQMSDMNGGYTITKLTAQKPISGKSQTQQLYIWCRDWGAYGKLKASVKVKGAWYEAEGDGTPDKFITIPQDLNNNHIADYWEKQNGVYGKPAEWDGDPNPTGQARTGDGMTNYEEYRGFFVSDGSGGKKYVRTDPNLKEIFVLDDDQIFDISSWQAASGINAYWLTKDMVYGSKGGIDIMNPQYRWVDFCQGTTAPGSKYAIHLVKVSGMIDTYGVDQGKYDFGYNDPGYGPPRAANLTVIFPDRLRNWLVESADTLAKYLKKYPTGFNVGGVSYSKKEIQSLIDEIKNPAELKVLVDFQENVTVLHEIGHACNVHHHGGGDTTKTGTGSIICPMIYQSEYDIAKLNLKMLSPVMKLIEKDGITPIVSYIGWRFCKTKDNCWKQIDVNDK
jgi:hypothetical protein